MMLGFTLMSFCILPRCECDTYLNDSIIAGRGFRLIFFLPLCERHRRRARFESLHHLNARYCMIVAEHNVVQREFLLYSCPCLQSWYQSYSIYLQPLFCTAPTLKMKHCSGCGLTPHTYCIQKIHPLSVYSTPRNEPGLPCKNRTTPTPPGPSKVFADSTRD